MAKRVNPHGCPHPKLSNDLRGILRSTWGVEKDVDFVRSRRMKTRRRRHIGTYPGSLLGTCSRVVAEVMTTLMHHFLSSFGGTSCLPLRSDHLASALHHSSAFPSLFHHAFRTLPTALSPLPGGALGSVKILRAAVKLAPYSVRRTFSKLDPT
jgi:hypothetical protein